MDITIETGPDSATAESATAGCAGGACTCGSGGTAVPVLDVLALPASVRHAAIHGALGAIPVSGSIVLAAPHEPLPLLAELEELHPGDFLVTYVERGPETWRLKFTRQQ